MIPFFRGKAVGLDIGSSVVKAVQLRRIGKEEIELEKFGMAEVYPSGERRASPDEVKAFKIEAVRRALADGDIKAKQSISAVSGESIIVRYIQLPDMPEQELKSALLWEAEEYIPFSIDEVNIDSAVLGKRQTESGEKVDVLFVAAKKEIINEHIEILRTAGLSPLIIDLDSFAFLNCYETSYQPDAEDVVALIDIGAEVTSINIYQGLTSRFARDIPLGGDNITSAIQSRLELDFLQAEELKKVVGVPFNEASGEGEPGESGFLSAVHGAVEQIAGGELGEASKEAIVLRTVKSSLSNLINEIRRSLQFFESQSSGVAIKKVILSGGTAKMSNLDKYLTAELGLPVEIINPLSRVKLAEKGLDKDKVERHKESLSVALGLAFRKVVD